MQRRLLSCALLVSLFLTTSEARADLIGLWVEAKGAYLSGSGETWKRFDNRVGGGVAGGVELLGIDVWGEALIMGSEQYFFTTNVGFDFTFGDEIRFELGAYTGPMFFLYPKDNAADAGPIDFAQLSADEQNLLLTLTGANSQADLNAQFGEVADAEGELDRLAFGWNLARARLALDFELVSYVYLGLAGNVGYHVVISGEDAAAGAKNKAIDTYADDNLDGLSDEQRGQAKDLLRRALGAQAIDTDSLNGVNFDVGLYLRLDF